MKTNEVCIFLNFTVLLNERTLRNDDKCIEFLNILVGHVSITFLTSDPGSRARWCRIVNTVRSTSRGLSEVRVSELLRIVY